MMRYVVGMPLANIPTEDLIDLGTRMAMTERYGGINVPREEHLRVLEELAARGRRKRLQELLDADTRRTCRHGTFLG